MTELWFARHTINKTMLKLLFLSNFALWKLLVLLGLNGTDHNKVSLKFLKGIRRFFSSLRNFKNFSSLAYII